MKKIITLLFVCSFVTKVFSSPSFSLSYHNITQNTWYQGTIGIPACNVTGNYGDSIELICYVNPGTASGWPEQWYLNGDSIPGTADTSRIKIKLCQPPGTYSAFISMGFWITVYYYAGNTTGIPPVENIHFLNIYPATVTSSITIQLHSIKPNDIEISFFDINGRQLKNDFYKNISGEFIKNENTEALSNGIYFIKIKAGDEMLQKKFVKMQLH